jgi:hypothetical protein
MAKNAVLIFALTSVALLTGCASTQAPVVITSASSDSAYLSSMRSLYDFTGTSDAKLIDAGNAVCGALDKGMTVQKLHVTMTTTPGADPKMVSTVLADAIMILCPEYTAALNAYMGK